MSKLPEGIRRLYRPGDKKGKPTGRYQARYPVRQTDGTVKQVSAGTFTSLNDAKDARSLQIAKLRTGGWVDPTGPRTTVEAWSTEWLALRRGGNTKTKTIVRSRIVPRWGSRRLGEITSLDVQRWVNDMLAEPLAPATVKAYYACFRQMMSHAVDHDLLPKTPCRNIELPVQRGTKTKVTLTVEQYLALEKAAPARFRAMIHLAAWAGLRWGECAGLRWEDVDLETGLLHICRGVTVDRKVGETKNRKNRYVKVAPETVEILRAHRRDFGDRPWVFSTATKGVMLGYADFRADVWLPLVKQCGLTGFTFHGLRHFHAATMVERGMDWKVLSDRLGHHAPSFTADVYGWKRGDADDVTVAAIQAAMRND